MLRTEDCIFKVTDLYIELSNTLNSCGEEGKREEPIKQDLLKSVNFVNFASKLL